MLCEVGGGNPVHGDGNAASQHNAVKSGYPFGAILAPQHHAIAWTDVSGLQLSGHPKRQLGHLPVPPTQRAETATRDEGVFAPRGRMKGSVVAAGLRQLSFLK